MLIFAISQRKTKTDRINPYKPNDMAIEIKHIADLSGYYFSIPAYQRGYRWEKKQVEQLLDDLLEFANFKEQIEDAILETNNSLLRNKVGFYCLQPLAVLDKGNKHYEVIDGQQRLTTIYLILSWMNGRIRNPYDRSSTVDSLKYYLTFDIREKDFFDNEEFTESIATNKRALDNIDFYFMAKAYSVIDEWFRSHKLDIDHIFDLLFPVNYARIISNNQLSPEERTKKLNQLNDVRFVWYQVDNADSSIPTFNDLNYGKISLTATELIKALLMQNGHNRDDVHSTNLQRSLEWSIMEQDRQDPFFWAMIHPQDDPCDLHLEYVLDIVSEQIYNSNKDWFDSKKWNKEDNDWDYLIINDYINKSNNTSEAIEDVWHRIQKVYNVFHNWFLSRTYYHQIGLLMLLIQRKNKNMKQKAGVEMRKKVMDLFDSYTNSLRSVFDEKLVDELGIATLPREIKEKDNQGKEITRRLSINELRYGEHDEDLRKVLMLYCVEECIMETNDAPRFPFHLMEKYQVYSLEHIHPQHLNDADISFDTLIRWYQDKKEILRKQGKLASQAIRYAVSFLDGRLVKEKEKDYENDKQPVLKQLDVIDKEFDQLSKMSDEHLHTLYNLALVGQNVNSALSNNLLDIKRDILKTHEYIDKDSYIPLGTWRAFNKYFSKEVSDLQFWSEDDRNAYFGEIERVYNKYHK